MSETNELNAIDGWAIVELFGRQMIAGDVSTINFGSEAFLRVDVPEHSGQKAFSRIFGVKAIYAITPTVEDEVMALLAKADVRPIDRWTLPDPSQQLPAQVIEAESSGPYDESDYDDDIEY